MLQFDADPDLSVAVLHGAGGKHFSAGGNLKRTNRLAADLGGGGDVASRLAKQIPRTALMWMIETASFLDAQAARDCFLVNEVVPDEEVMERARAVADMVAALPPLAVRAEKTAIVNLEDVPFDQAVVLARSIAALVELTGRSRRPGRRTPGPSAGEQFMSLA